MTKRIEKVTTSIEAAKVIARSLSYFEDKAAHDEPAVISNIADIIQRFVADPLGAENARIKEQVTAFWNMVFNCWDIEPREFFEQEIAKGIGYDNSPLAMAVHYMWKREVKETNAVAEERDAALKGSE